MDKLFNVVLGFVLLIITLIAANTNFNYTNKNVSTSFQTCTKEVYYFQDEHLNFVQADKQKFRILFTGEVINAYFYLNNKEYSTNNYYKENRTGFYKKGKCIVENN